MCFKKFVPCRNCSKKQGPEPGYYYAEFNNQKVIVECDCHKKYRKERDLSRNLLSANINTDYTFDNYRGTKSLQDLNAFKQIAENPKKYLIRQNYYIWGLNGCQKTSMSQVLGKELIKQGYKVQYILMGNLLNSLIKEFDDPNNEAKDITIKKCMECDLLIIDECFDKSKVTIYNSGYQLPFLDNFLRTRFDLQGKPTMFISNKKANEIESQGYGISIQNLVERTTVGGSFEFTDVYLDEISKPDRLALFK